MKLAIAILVLLLILGGWYLLSSEEAAAPSTTDVPADTSMEATPETDAVEAPAAEEETPAVAEETPVVEEVPDTTASEASEPTAVTFTLDSFNFGYSETELRVKQGTTVTINLTNSGGFHDWVVDEFAAATDQIRAGDITSVTFVADQAGSFEYYCSVGSHRAQGMVGTLIVE